MVFFRCFKTGGLSFEESADGGEGQHFTSGRPSNWVYLLKTFGGRVRNGRVGASVGNDESLTCLSAARSYAGMLRPRTTQDCEPLKCCSSTILNRV